MRAALAWSGPVVLAACASGEVPPPDGLPGAIDARRPDAAAIDARLADGPTVDARPIDAAMIRARA
jgi:hypothetical protein